MTINNNFFSNKNGVNIEKWEIEPLVLRPEEVAEILRISKSQVYTLCREGEIPAFYIGRNLRIPSRDFSEWLDSQYSGLVSHAE